MDGEGPAKLDHRLLVRRFAIDGKGALVVLSLDVTFDDWISPVSLRISGEFDLNGSFLFTMLDEFRYILGATQVLLLSDKTDSWKRV